MQGIGDCRIDLGPECDQSRSVGRAQLENSNKLRSNPKQTRAMPRLIVRFHSGRPDIAKLREQMMSIVNHAGLGHITEQ